MQLNPYLNFNGQCEEAFKFYEQSLGGKIKTMMTYEGTPMEQKMPPEWRNKVIHGRLEVGGTVVMGSDAPSQHYHQPQGFSVTLSIDNVAEAERVFKTLAEGGKVQMEIQKTFWAERFGMLFDRFGIPWMINCERAA